MENKKTIIKSVIPFKPYTKAEENERWEGTKEIREADVKDLKIICTWYDSEKPDVKASYKLPHHKANGYAVVWNGVKAAMGALLGARGGVKIPEKDRKRVYNHLAKHYKQFQKFVPNFKTNSDKRLDILIDEFKEVKKLVIICKEKIENKVNGED